MEPFSHSRGNRSIKIDSQSGNQAQLKAEGEYIWKYAQRQCDSRKHGFKAITGNRKIYGGELSA